MDSYHRNRLKKIERAMTKPEHQAPLQIPDDEAGLSCKPQGTQRTIRWSGARMVTLPRATAPRSGNSGGGGRKPANYTKV